LGLGLGIGLGLAFFKDLCDNKLMCNIGSKFDGGACNYNNCQRLPMMVYLEDLRS